MILLAKLSMQVGTNREKVFSKRDHKKTYSREETVGEI